MKMYPLIVYDEPKMDGDWLMFFFPILVCFEVMQIATFQKTVFCSRSILSFVLVINAWFNRFRVLRVKFSIYFVINRHFV